MHSIPGVPLLPRVGAQCQTPLGTVDAIGLYVTQSVGKPDDEAHDASKSSLKNVICALAAKADIVRIEQSIIFFI